MVSPLPRRRSARLILLALALLAGGCASQPRVTGPEEKAPPPPFTADEIRLANPPGTEMVFRIEREGTPPVRRLTRFLSGDEQHAVIETEEESADGHAVGRPERGRATWTELREHAAFPPDATYRCPAVCPGPTGTYDCWLYIVSGQDGEGAVTESRFYFARRKPGPPVLYEVEKGGKVVFRMTLVKDSRP